MLKRAIYIYIHILLALPAGPTGGGCHPLPSRLSKRGVLIIISILLLLVVVVVVVVVVVSLLLLI